MNLQRLMFYGGVVVLLTALVDASLASPELARSELARSNVEREVSQLQTNASLDPIGLESWNNFLLNDQLREALLGDTDVPAELLAKSIARYRVAERNVSRMRFVRLGETLEDWSKQLTGAEACGLELGESLSELAEWLATKPTRGERWTKYLRLKELGEQQSPGEVVDVDAVREVLDRFESGKPGLDRRLFARVRRSLQVWLGALDGDTAIYDKVRSATEDVTQWIRRGGRQRKFWPPILELEDLQEQIEAGNEADSNVVEVVRARIVSEAAIDRQAFMKVRRALENWYAETQTPTTSSLAATIRSRTREYRPISPAALVDARNRMTQSLVGLENYLAGGGERKAGGWKRFLKWDALQEQFQSADGPSFVQLAAIYKKFSSGESGLSKPAFVTAAKDMRVYLERLRLAETRVGRVESARRAISNTFSSLERELASRGADIEADWRERLPWNSIKEVLADDDPSAKVLAKIRKNLAAKRENAAAAPTALKRLETGLDRYAELIRLRDRQPNAADLFAARMESLSKAVESHEQNPTADSAAQIANQLDWLDTTGQASEMIADIRRRYLNSNLTIEVKGSVLLDRIARDVTDTSPVSETMEGVQIKGTAKTKARISARLLPSSDGARLEIELSGRTFSKTVGKKRRVSVCAKGTTDIYGSQTIVIRPTGLSALQPSAHTSTDQKITGVGVNRKIGRRLVTKIARKMANKALPKGERMADQKARRQVVTQMKEGSAELVAQANQTLRDKIEDPLKDKGLYPDEVSVRSTAQDLSLLALVHFGQFRLGAPSLPPLTGYGSDIVGKVHESMINNLLAAKIGGVKIDSEQVAEMMDKYNLEEAQSASSANKIDKPDNENQDEEDESWSITFNRLQPATFSFKDDRVRVGLRAQKITRGGNPEKFRIEMAATYSVAVHGVGQFELIRDGQPEINFLGHTGTLSVEQLAVKTFILRKIEALYRPRFSIDDLPAGDLVELLKKIEVEHLDFIDGWAMAGLPVDTLQLEL